MVQSEHCHLRKLSWENSDRCAVLQMCSTIGEELSVEVMLVRAFRTVTNIIPRFLSQDVATFDGSCSKDISSGRPLKEWDEKFQSETVLTIVCTSLQRATS